MSNHDCPGLEQSNFNIRREANQVRCQTGNRSGRDAMLHATVFGVSFKYLTNAKAQTNINQRRSEHDLFCVHPQCLESRQHQHRDKYGQETKCFANGNAGFTVQIREHAGNAAQPRSNDAMLGRYIPKKKRTHTVPDSEYCARRNVRLETCHKCQTVARDHVPCCKNIT